jgi:hypothetical protein
MEDLNHSKKLEFLHKIAKLGMSHYQGGGLIGGLGNALGVGNNFTAGGAPTSQELNNSLTQSNNAISGLQNIAGITLPGATTGTQNQNALASQLLAMSQGQGPNPAQAQLAQATQANTANQAALMAGQRGAGQNVGLIARQSAQQGAANQQAAAGQAATMEAQQQIAAQNNLANLSAQQVGQAGQAAGSVANAAGNQLGTLETANAAANSTNANVAGQNAATNSGLLGSITGGLGSALGLAKGGPVKMAEGGISPGAIQAPTSSGSWVADYMNSGPMSSSSIDVNSGAKAFKSGMQAGAGFKLPSGGNPMQGATSMQGSDDTEFGGSSVGNSGVSGLSGAAASNPLSGAASDFALSAKGGEIRQMADRGAVVKATTPNEKAKKSGNSYSNDKVPAMLSEGEVVIDRDTLDDKGPVGQMARAIRAHIEARNKK